MPKIGKNFTAKAIAGLKKAGTYSDETHKGLSLRISTTGNKSWILRFYIHSKENRIKLCGDLPWADVRARFLAMRQEVEGGTDPAKAKREKILTDSKQQTLAQVGEDWFTLAVGKLAQRTTRDYRYNLDKLILPSLGKYPLEELDKPLLAGWHNRINRDNGPRSATLSLAVLKSMLSWAVDQGRLEHNPALGVKPAVRHKPKERYLSESEIKELCLWLDQATVDKSIIHGLKLILLTGCRPGEVASIHSREIEGDWWIIPSSRTKNGNEHRVYLTKMAKSLMINKRGYLLPSPRKMAQAITPASFTRTLNRHRTTLANQGVESFSAHDLRRSAATHIARIGHSGIVPDLLNHTPTGITRQVYDRHSRDPEKQRALLAWEREIQRIINGAESACVVKIENYR